MKLGKKLIALTLVAALAMTCVVGCERKAVVPDNEEVVMVINDQEIKMGLTNFYVRYQQSMVEGMYVSYMGDNAWIQKAEDGVTYEEGMKEAFLTELQEMLIVAQNVEEYEVTLTEEELAEIETAAASFDKENSAEVKKLVSGEKEIVIEYFKLIKLNDKMRDAIKAKADTEVTDDEAAQKKMRYVTFTEKADAEEFLKAAKANGSLEAYATDAEKASKTQTFDEDSTALGEAVIKAADELELNAFADVIEVKKDDAKEYYVIQLESLFDETATEAEKANIVKERQEKLYADTVEKWVKDAEIELKEEVWEKISLDGLSVLPVTEETKDKTDETKDNATTDATK